MKVFLDIETGPGDYEWRVEKMKRLIAPPANYKTEEAIANWWEREGNLKLYGVRESFALSPLYGRILCIGWMAEDEQEPTVGTLEEFMAAIKKLCETSTPVTFVGHNIKRFDLPFLRFACIKEGISPYPIPQVTDRYSPWIIDTWEMTGGRDFGGNGLGDLARLFGIQNRFTDKDVTAAHTLDPDLLQEYCKNDVVMVAELYHRLTGSGS